jgi:hypothetical protein
MNYLFLAAGILEIRVFRAEDMVAEARAEDMVAEARAA